MNFQLKNLENNIFNLNILFKSEYIKTNYSIKIKKYDNNIILNIDSNNAKKN